MKIDLKLYASEGNLSEADDAKFVAKRRDNWEFSG